MKKITLFLFGLCISHVFGQVQNAEPRPSCGTMHALAERIKTDPSIAESIQKMKEEAFQNNASGSRSSMANVTIPVVFHVVYNNATENIPDYRLLDQLRVLNEDFRKMNEDTFKIPAAWKGIAADAQVNFCLAQRDPSGNPTSGITRTYTTATSFTDDDQVKYATYGKTAWDKTKYLNYWVCDLGSSLLGYAQFPGGGPNATDGVVIHYKYTGTTGSTYPYDKGRTATHEIGHWLNLYHIWGDDGGACSGSDNVTDTPNQADEHYGFIDDYTVVTDACSTTSPGVMWMDYMDYTDDASLYMFTNGQKTRMQNILTGAGFGNRTSLSTSLGCTPAAITDASITKIKRPESGMCNPTVDPLVTLTNKGSATLTTTDILYTIDGGPVTSYTFFVNVLPSGSTDIILPAFSLPAAGTHTIKVYTANPNGTADQLTSNDTLSMQFTSLAGSPVSYPFSEGFESATFPPTGWTVVNPDANVNTWKRGTSGGFANSTASARMDNLSGLINVSDLTDDLISPSISLSGANISMELTFNVAHVMYGSAYSDSLFVEVSTDCGNNWQRVYTKGGTSLETKTTTQSSAFVPTSSQWRTETVNLGAYGAGYSSLNLRFRSKSGSGNYIFVDDVNLNNTIAGVNDLSVQNMILYPNPSTGSFTLENTPKDMVVNIYSTLGKWMGSFVANGNKQTLDMSIYKNGVYYITGKYSGGVITRKITIVH